MVSEVLRRYRVYLSRSDIWSSILISFCIFCISLVYNFYTSVYATSHVSNYVEDIILSNIPTYDVGGIFVWGALALIFFVVCLSLTHPKRIPFILHALSLFYAIRGTFVMLTHLAPYPTRTPLDVDLGTLFAKQFGGADLFFSAHTGAPFLLALIFWKHRTLRYIFLASSALFAIVVLLGHFHYSIDVLSAFFITYSIFHLAEYFFKKDRVLFNSEV